MRKMRVVANMTSVVFCDKDGTANFVEHLLEGNTMHFSATGETIGKGYIRCTGKDGENLILYMGDWEVCS